MKTTELDTRTHPVLQNTDNRNTVNFGITTKCSMKCPACSVNVPGMLKAGTARHLTLSECGEAAGKMQWLRRIHITGGEPTLHPYFKSACLSIRNIARPAFYTLETNGYDIIQHLTDGKWVEETFDLVFITHYERDAVYPGNPDNTRIIEKAQTILGDKLIVEPPVKHLDTHKTIQLGNKYVKGDRPEPPCSKFYKPGLPAAFYNGKMYSCCVSFGIDESLGRPIDYYWRNWINELPMGCDACCFRGT